MLAVANDARVNILTGARVALWAAGLEDRGDRPDGLAPSERVGGSSVERSHSKSRHRVFKPRGLGVGDGLFHRLLYIDQRQQYQTQNEERDHRENAKPQTAEDLVHYAEGKRP